MVTVSSFTMDEDFTGASLVLTSLGDAPEDDTRVLSNPLGLDVGPEVRVADLLRILELPRP
jgi:hypothetical protein